MKKITVIIPSRILDNKLIYFIRNFQKRFKKIKLNFVIIVKEIGIKKPKIKNSIILIQKKKGFMNACFEAINYVSDEYFTFIYDDDIFSKEIEKMYEKVKDYEFVMTYGKVSNIKKKYKFDKINFKEINSNEILNTFYGGKISKLPFTPVSPICAIFEKKILKKWKSNIIKYCRKSKLRKKFLLDLNIGPDLILYLTQLSYLKKEILFTFPNQVYFVNHKNSMSYILGQNKLQIGYWIAKNIIFDQNKLEKKQIEKYYTYTLFVGKIIMYKNLLLRILNKENFYYYINKEISFLQKKKIKTSIFYILEIIYNKLFRLIIEK